MEVATHPMSIRDGGTLSGWEATVDVLEKLKEKCNGQHVPMHRKNGSLAICLECDRPICAGCGLCIQKEE